MSGARLPLFLDVDTGVDDAMALVYLFGSTDADLVGIASTAGNVPVQQVCENNLALLELCGISVPVSMGSPDPLSTPPGPPDVRWPLAAGPAAARRTTQRTSAQIGVILAPDPLSGEHFS